MTVAAMRYVLSRIAEALGCSPDDDEDLVEAARRLVAERDEARRDLGAILAVIHRDGGHHTGEHGLSQSVTDAHATWASVVRERDEARAEVERLRARVRSVDRSTAYEGTAFSDGESSQEAEVERLRADLARCREVQRATAEGWRHEVAEVAAIVGAPPHTAELAACVRAEVERLKAERDEAKEHARLAKMIAARVQGERDEARAEVERLREALRAIAAGFDPITGSVDDPSAKQVDEYYRGYAMAALGKGGK